MNYQYQKNCSVEELDDPYPNSVLQTLSPQFIQEILPDDDPEPITSPKPGFWRRQFGTEVTRGQRKFDWMFGVIMPAICFYFDPIVFQGSFGEGPLLGAYSTFAHLLSYATIMAMVAVLVWDKRPASLNAMLAGLFGASALVSLIIGVILVPFSIMGLFFFFIGALGFTPLLSAIVFLRNSVRAHRAATALIPSRTFHQ
jgi:hypothetical protein